MNIPASRSIKGKSDVEILEAQKEAKIRHNLMVKIIIWKSKYTDERSINALDKISSKEWLMYQKYIFEIVTNESRDKILTRIQETKEIIKKLGGFE